MRLFSCDSLVPLHPRRMTIRKEEVSCGLVFALLMLAAGTPTAQAADPIQVYQDRAAWEAAASAAGLDTGLETFDGFDDTFPDGTVPDFSVGPIDFATNLVSGLGGDGGGTVEVRSSTTSMRCSSGPRTSPSRPVPSCAASPSTMS